MILSRTVSALLACTGVILASGPVRATAQHAPTLEELARRSDVIVRGTVIAVTAHASGPGGRPGIHTEVQVAAEEFIMGPPRSVVTFWVHGGRLGRRARVVVGQARFTVGERVLVLLFDAGGGVLFPTGMSRGKWRWKRDSVASTDGRTTVSLPELRARLGATTRR